MMTKPNAAPPMVARSESSSMRPTLRRPAARSLISIKMARMAASVAPGRYEIRDGTPYSSEYGDVFHSAGGGPAQARHVFLAGNELPARWRRRRQFVILETGFGFGLNFLVTWRAWKEDAARCERLHFVSIEKHPFTLSDLRALHELYPELADEARALHAAWPPLV